MQYRQVTYKLRVQRGAGRPDLVSTRPTKTGRKVGEYLDSEAEPTLVEFDEHCQVDIPSLLAMGAIVEWRPAKPKPSKAEPQEPEVA